MGHPTAIELSHSDKLFREAEQKEERRDFKGAFKSHLAAAQCGSVLSELALGNFYSSGRGVRKNTQEAARWYRKAYRSGLSAGAVNLAVDLERQGNLRGATEWLKRAAEMNDGEAYVHLARLRMAKRGGTKTAVCLLKTALSLNRSEISGEAREQAKGMLKSMATIA